MNLIENFGPSLIGTAIGSLAAALVVQLVSPKIIGFRPRFTPTYFAAFVGAIGSAAIGFVAALLILEAGGTVDGAAMILVGVIGFFTQVGLYVLCLHKPDGGSITFGRSLLLTLVQLIVGVVLFALYHVTRS